MNQHRQKEWEWLIIIRKIETHRKIPYISCSPWEDIYKYERTSRNTVSPYPMAVKANTNEAVGPNTASMVNTYKDIRAHPEGESSGPAGPIKSQLTHLLGVGFSLLRGQGLGERKKLVTRNCTHQSLWEYATRVLWLSFKRFQTQWVVQCDHFWIQGKSPSQLRVTTCSIFHWKCLDT